MSALFCNDQSKEDSAMDAYKQEFIDFMVESDVLKFGDFTLKSGRKSPFFMKFSISYQYDSTR